MNIEHCTEPEDSQLFGTKYNIDEIGKGNNDDHDGGGGGSDDNNNNNNDVLLAMVPS